MNESELSNFVAQRLEDFYRRRLQKLTELKLNQTLRKKNPYLFRAVGVMKACEIVESLLQAYMSSSEETIFGDAFFEPIVKEVCSGVAAGGTGVDVVIETQDTYTVISVKSGPNWGNSSQMEKLRQDFNTAYHVFSNKKLKKNFKALLGHCYGQKQGEPTPKRAYAIRSGQAFWTEITGDPDFYLKLIHAMGKLPVIHRALYEQEWNKALNRFEREFLNEFSTPYGEIDWEKLLRFNSGIKSQKI